MPPEATRHGATGLIAAPTPSDKTSPVAGRPGAKSTPTYLAGPILLTAALTALAAALRLYRIDRTPLWLDEGYSLLFSRLPFWRVIFVGGAHEHPPLYYLLVHLALSIWDSPYAPRIISAVAGSLTVSVLYLLASRLYGRLSGVLAAAFLTISPFHIWFAREGRGYALAGLFVLLSYLFAFTAIQRPRRALWVAYAGAIVLSVYTEYATVLALVPQALLMARASNPQLVRSLLLSWLGAGAVVLPWLVVAAPNAAAVAAGYWIPPPSLGSVGVTVLEMLGLTSPCIRPPCASPGGLLGAVFGGATVVAVIVSVTVCLLFAVALARRDDTLVVVVSWLAFPFFAVVLISIRRSLYVDRVFLDASFPAYLLAGAGIARLTRRTGVALPLVAALLLSSLAGAAALQSAYQARGYPDWKGATRDFRSAYRPGESVVAYPGVAWQMVSAYLPGDWRGTAVHTIWLHNYLDVPGWQRRFASVSDEELRNLQLSSASAGRGRVWLIAQGYTGLDSARHWFTVHGFELVLSETYNGDVRLELYDRDTAQAFGKVLVTSDFLAPTWTAGGPVRRERRMAAEEGKAVLATQFQLQPGHAYSVRVEYRAFPRACPGIAVVAYDSHGRSLGTFPRTKWYDLPVNGIWLSQPFGFVAPEGATRAALLLESSCGLTDWRNVAVNGEP